MMTLSEMCQKAGVASPPGSDRIVCHPDGNDQYSPFDHQISGLNILAGQEWSERSALWDEPGVGKTIPMQALILLYHLSGIKCLMVMPPKLIGRWLSDFKRDWTVPDDLGFDYLVQDMTPKKRDEKYAEYTMDDSWPPLMLMSYERIRRDGSYLKSVGYRAFLFDEADKLSNAETKLWGAVWRLFYASKGMYGVHLFTGSEIRNVPTDAYGLIKLIDPELFFDYAEFYNMFVDQAITVYKEDPDTGRKFENIIGYTYKNLDKLGEIMCRRARKITLREVQKDLPELRPVEVPVDLSPAHRKLYRNLINTRLLEVNGELLNAEHASQLRQYAGRILSCPHHYVDDDKAGKFKKDNTVLQAADEIIESVNPRKHKIIVWAWYKDTIDYLKERYAEFNPAVIYGGQSPKDSEANRIKFETSDECGMMIANWGAGGAGFNWQVARYMLFVENPTTPRDVQQAVARMERTGQKFAMVCYFLRVLGTVADKSFSKMVDKTRKVTEINGREFPVQAMEVELFGGSDD